MTQEPTAENVVLDRFRQRCRVAGGPRAGYVLRRASILYVQKDHPELDLESGISELVSQQILKANETGSFLFLTAEGIDRLSSP